jgi:hypothetical protein
MDTVDKLGIEFYRFQYDRWLKNSQTLKDALVEKLGFPPASVILEPFVGDATAAAHVQGLSRGFSYGTDLRYSCQPVHCRHDVARLEVTVSSPDKRDQWIREAVLCTPQTQ